MKNQSKPKENCPVYHYFDDKQSQQKENTFSRENVHDYIQQQMIKGDKYEKDR